MHPSLRTLKSMVTLGLMQKRRWFLLIKIVPCLLFVTYVVHRIRPIGLDGKQSANDYDYQTESLVNFVSSLPPSLLLLPASLTPSSLRSLINLTNSRETVNNLDKYGSLNKSDPVIVVQVHDRVEYLQSLINSLENVSSINKSLIIFTHDVYSPLINAVIQRIQFCKVMQLFYPYSLQAYPNQFPGADPKDCPRDVKHQEALRVGCQNADHPDTYGHYREASYTQTKHHWFWKINTIFDKLNITKNHDGPFIFLEEDHYAVPDMLHMLRLMQDLRQRNQLGVDLLTLGVYAKSVNYQQTSDKLEIQSYISSRHNMGMVVDRKAWEKIRSCSKHFCTYDDYNWDWSLQHISEKCLRKPLRTLSVIAPRVFHVGECGVHHKSADCSKNRLIYKVRQTLRASTRYIFPSQVSVQRTSKKVFKMPKVNGGWGDIRDQILCLQQVVHPEQMEHF